MVDLRVMEALVALESLAAFLPLPTHPAPRSVVHSKSRAESVHGVRHHVVVRVTAPEVGHVTFMVARSPTDPLMGENPVTSTVAV